MEVLTYKYKAKGKQFYFRMTLRASIEFETLKGYPVPLDPTWNDSVVMAYVGTAAGMKEKGQLFEMSLDEYIDFIDTDIQGLAELFNELNPQGEKKKKVATKGSQ